jgi:hypothetical protein
MLLVGAGLVGPAVFWGLGAFVAMSWPGYDWVSQSISSLVHAPLGELQTLAFLLGGLLSLGWAIGAGRIMGRTDRQGSLVRGLFLVQAGLLVAFALLPTDPDDVSRTLTGNLHLLTFFSYSVAMPVMLLVVALILRRDPRWQRAAAPTAIAGATMLIATTLVPFTLTGPLYSWLGLLERAYVLIPSGWQATMAGVALWRMCRRDDVRSRG